MSSSKIDQLSGSAIRKTATITKDQTNKMRGAVDKFFSKCNQNNGK